MLTILILIACGTSLSTNQENSAPQAGFTSLAQGADQPAMLNVFAAASLAEAFNAIAQDFEQNHPGVMVLFNFAGSQQLAQQLIQGAPADIFASANQKQMNVVIQEGSVRLGPAQIFARNRLVVVTPANNPGHITNPADLTKNDLRLVLAASEVPAGQYALEFLEKASRESAYGTAYKDLVLANVVSYEDSVKAVLNKVVLGEADGGIVYISDANAKSTESLTQIEIPESLNVEASYPIAVVTDSSQADLAKAFVEGILSLEGQEILESFGFKPIRR